MKTILQTTSFLLVSHVYKWILPLATTILMLFFANQDRSLLIRYLLWFFSCLSYLTIPINFEHPKYDAYSYFLNKNFVSTVISTALAFTLSSVVFVLTALSIVIYFPQFESHSILIGTINSLLYLGTLLLEFWLLPIKLQTHSSENKA
jgi:hypothetical protein